LTCGRCAASVAVGTIPVRSIWYSQAPQRISLWGLIAFREQFRVVLCVDRSSPVIPMARRARGISQPLTSLCVERSTTRLTVAASAGMRKVLTILNARVHQNRRCDP